MVVMEAKTNIIDAIDGQLTQEHGHLVAQILETQRELIHTDNVDVIPKKVDIVRTYLQVHPSLIQQYVNDFRLGSRDQNAIVK